MENEIFNIENLPLLESIKKNYCKIKETADPKIIQSEHHAFKINHIYSTQKIEGSTMTFGQTHKLLEFNLSPKDIEIEHVIEAKQTSTIFDELLTTTKDISKKLLLSWHEKLFEKTDTNNAGSFRRVDVQPYLGKTEYVLWADVISDIDELVKWYNKNKKISKSGTAICNIPSKIRIDTPVHRWKWENWQIAYVADFVQKQLSNDEHFTKRKIHLYPQTGIIASKRQSTGFSKMVCSKISSG